ncbi:hypothetical protein CMMCAS02_10435 [Clavibacter michiganensis subsp. michiganensis]|uniref:Uncharacterized protein n=1 Tax=Clavibacter michiganensis subsp. michiganensis TaxID=33013 RepID=A0A1Y3FK90_CLAMM|nr:hypothetical protein DOU02_03335 [Clavibacter michiganensis subsp. michiganensis]OUD83329.1 hypothetical protein CMMCAS02_10435 [Clavibacter michiganensis subsp. michiganensis]OUD85103.1 hypothetical protein BC477_11880 [Clavibacter michiganensis subsp. michiganensis]OUD86247.1 hypothetical protein CMMCAS03_13330 [Clavibacter michiganensis subsp. michiganensis]OUD95340.1 hypothetical protein CMMCAS05_02205 [Clavibacter michiganensis subsp. michiganensis]
MFRSSGIAYRPSTLPTVDRGMRRWYPIRCGPHRRVTRNAMMRRSMRVGVRFGLRAGHDDRSVKSSPAR